MYLKKKRKRKMLVEALLVEKNGTTNETSFHLPS